MLNLIFGGIIIVTFMLLYPKLIRFVEKQRDIISYFYIEIKIGNETHYFTKECKVETAPSLNDVKLMYLTSDDAEKYVNILSSIYNGLKIKAVIKKIEDKQKKGGNNLMNKIKIFVADLICSIFL